MSGFSKPTDRLRSKAAVCFAAATVALLLAVAPALSPLSGAATQKRESARAQFEKAEAARQALQGKPLAERKLSEYQAVLRMYRNVPILAPTVHQAPDSIFQAAQLNEEMAQRFQQDAAKYRAEARNLYQSLLRQYPQTRYRKQSNQAIAIMDTEEESAAAASPPARVAVVSSGSQSAGAQSEDNRDRASSKLVTISSIREWSTPNYTRVVIDVEDEVKFEAGRIANPDRIYFDLHNTKLTPALKDHNKEIEDGLLKKVRTGVNRMGTTRVVLEVGPVTTYSAFLLPNPYRLVIDIQGSAHSLIQSASASTPAPPTIAAKLEPAPRSTEIKPEPRTDAVETAAPKPAANTRKTKAKPAEVAGEPKLEPVNDAKPAEVQTVDASSKPSSRESKALALDGAGELKGGVHLDAAGGVPADPVDAEFAKNSAVSGNVEIPSTNGPTTEPVYEKVSPAPLPLAPLSASALDSRSSSRPARSDSVRPIAAPSPNSSGQRSLTRALGLKIGRVVIDAGHGGHDTGTIGPSGYPEKDLVLDVALRLGAMVEERLGSEVVYTRSDDTFVPLEMRTAIANQKQADLFVSIHANASRDTKARGIETYYLSFSTSQDALEVAARENAVSEKSIHELQDLVKKITLYEKVEESKEFAFDVQKSLYTGMSRGNNGLRNRGVRKAPFVVLIGANMPSILAEISFVSNPQDEKLLKKPEYRQRIAESLFRGIQHYASSLGGVKVASQRAEVPGQ
jgi:N-acetylmuramoyl-L-alanine amidase